MGPARYLTIAVSVLSHAGGCIVLYCTVLSVSDFHQHLVIVCEFEIVRVPWGWTWIRLIKFFSLQILVAQVVLIENPLDDIASPLGISSNMRIKAAITRNPFCRILAEVNMLEQCKWCLYPGFQGQGII